MSIVFVLIILLVAWVVLILPKQRELKRHNALVAALAVGDDVMTGSGIYGTLTEVGADTVSLSIAPGVEIKVARRAIAAKVTSTAARRGARCRRAPRRRPRRARARLGGELTCGASGGRGR